MTTFRSVPCFVRFGLLLAVLFVFTMSGDVQAQQQRKPNKPAPRAPYYNPLVLDYQGAMQQINNLPVAYYAPRYYPPYPPYPYPYPHPRPVPYPMPGPIGSGNVR